MAAVCRPFREADWTYVWPIVRTVARSGESYPYSTDLDEVQARNYWIEQPAATYVAVLDEHVVGTYYIKPNQPHLGAHVANCGYMVDSAARGKGVARTMCTHSQQEALRLGYLAMQYNLVVASNEVAVALWQDMGFHIVGTLSKAYRHARLGLVDAHIMYKILVEE